MICPKAKSATNCLTELFSIYQNKHGTIRRWDDHIAVQSSHHNIFKIDWFEIALTKELVYSIVFFEKTVMVFVFRFQFVCNNNISASQSQTTYLHSFKGCKKGLLCKCNRIKIYLLHIKSVICRKKSIYKIVFFENFMQETAQQIVWILQILHSQELYFPSSSGGSI